MQDIIFNQAMIAQLTKSGPLVISRLIKSREINALAGSASVIKNIPWWLLEKLLIVFMPPSSSYQGKVLSFYNFKGELEKPVFLSSRLILLF
jgi:hypothetical protein